MSGFNDRIIAEFRKNDGKVGGPFAGSHLVLLTTTGAKSGKKRTAPAMWFPDGDRILVIASYGGAPKNPAWYHNLLANPRLSVEVATDSGIDAYEATAVPVTGEERDILFARAAQKAPGFATYQTKTSRVIPMIALYRATD